MLLRHCFSNASLDGGMLRRDTEGGALRQFNSVSCENPAQELFFLTMLPSQVVRFVFLGFLSSRGKNEGVK